MKDKMLAFLDQRNHCVISTVDPARKPESAFVAFSNNGLDITIGTSSQSRKYQNLVANPSVAIVVADESGEVQYEGQASVVDEQNDVDIENAHIHKLPGSAKYRTDPNQRYVRITPTWVRYIEHGDVDQMEEFTEF